MPRYLRNTYEPDPFFAVEFCGSSYSTMLAPGLSTFYRVRFMPEKSQDYHYEMKFATDAGDLIVPVIGAILGPMIGEFRVNIE